MILSVDQYVYVRKEYDLLQTKRRGSPFPSHSMTYLACVICTDPYMDGAESIRAAKNMCLFRI